MEKGGKEQMESDKMHQFPTSFHDSSSQEKSVSKWPSYHWKDSFVLVADKPQPLKDRQTDRKKEKKGKKKKEKNPIRENIIEWIQLDKLLKMIF